MNRLVRRSLELSRRHTWVEALTFYLVVFALLSLLEIALSTLSEVLLGVNGTTIKQLDDVFGIGAVLGSSITIFRAKHVFTSSRIMLTIVGITLAFVSVPFIGLGFNAFVTMLSPQASSD